MLCPNCEQEVPDGKRFCGYCGHRLIQEEPVEPLIKDVDSAQTGDFDQDAPTELVPAIPIQEPPSDEELVDQDMRIIAGPDESPADTEELLPLNEASVIPAAGEELHVAPEERIEATATRRAFYRYWLAVLFTGLGWGLGALLGHVLFVQVAESLFLLLSVAGTIGGLSLGLALRWFEPTIRWRDVLIITVVWFIAWGAAWIAGSALGLESAWNLAKITFEALLVSLGGLLTGLVFFKSNRKKYWKSIGVLTLVWGCATAFGLMFAWLLDTLNWRVEIPFSGFYIPSTPFLANFTIGAIGTALTYLQLIRVRNAGIQEEKYSYGSLSMPDNRKIVLAILLTSLGWVIAELFVSYMFYLVQEFNLPAFMTLLVNGIIAGAFIGAAIRIVHPSLKWLHMLTIVAGWTLAWVGRYFVLQAIGGEGGWSFEWWLLRIMAAFIAGLITALVIQRSQPRLQKRNLLAISTGWSLAWFVGSVLAGYLTFINVVHGFSMSFSWNGLSFSVAWLIGVAVAGALGAGITIWELKQIDQEDSTK
jgi:hypothetical protein